MKSNEKMMRELEKYIQDHCEDERDLEKIGHEFMELYNTHKLPERNLSKEEQAQELVYELDDCQSEKEYIALLEKILELDPENLDALFLSLDVWEDDADEQYENLVRLGEKKMKEKGFCNEDSIGHYWGIIETRPFMRIKKAYLEYLMEHGKFMLALEEAKDMMRLCEHDNLGVRYSLITIYARLQQYEEAKNFFEQWDEPSAFMYIPMIILNYQMNKREEAIQCYEEFQSYNKNCKKVFKKKGINIKQLEASVEAQMYAPFSEEEIYIALSQNICLLMENMETIMDFFVEHLVKATTSKKKKKEILH
ncbi:MAG: hypothetical protein RR531_10510 [Longicatena sp.]